MQLANINKFIKLNVLKVTNKKMTMYEKCCDINPGITYFSVFLMCEELNCMGCIFLEKLFHTF